MEVERREVVAKVDIIVGLRAWIRRLVAAVVGVL